MEVYLVVRTDLQWGYDRMAKGCQAAITLQGQLS